jgi:hypothetical protein
VPKTAAPAWDTRWISQPDIPAGYHTVTPRMVVADPFAELEFLRSVFHATGELRATGL